MSTCGIGVGQVEILSQYYPFRWKQPSTNLGNFRVSLFREEGGAQERWFVFGGWFPNKTKTGVLQKPCVTLTCRDVEHGWSDDACRGSTRPTDAPRRRA